MPADVPADALRSSAAAAIAAVPSNCWVHDVETRQEFLNLWGGPLAHRNLHGRVETLPDGTRIGGLGGIFRGLVWNARTPGAIPHYKSRAEHARFTPRQDRWRDSVSLKHWATIYPDDIEQLAKLQADVLVTHEAPGYRPHGFAVLDVLARRMGVKVAIHGHHHDAIDSSAHWPTQGFRTYGVGEAGITAVDRMGNAQVIVPGRQQRKDDESAALARAFRNTGSG